MDEKRDTASEDRIYREGVLMFLLLETRLATAEEIVTYRQAFQSADEPKAVRDGTERAIRDLAALGVLNVEGSSVYVSRAAREAARLVEGPDPDIAAW